jgi:GT2 family glycosyltransferase
MSVGRVSAIVVTRNNRREIGRTLASFSASCYPLHEVIVLDHASSDGTADYVRREHPDVVLLDFLDNPGFGEGNNRGARVATGDYLLLVNPDATIDAEALGTLVHALDSNPHAGIAVPKVLIASEPQIINSAGLVVNQIGYGWDRGYLEWDHGQHDNPGPVLAGSGCALLVRTEMFKALGGFDAPYFLYYEDLDLCWRSWLAGHAVTYVPKAVVRHAMKITSRPAFYNEYLDHRNRLRTLAKTLCAGSLVGRLPQLAAFEAGSVWVLARTGRWDLVRLRTQALTWHLGQLPDTLRRRRAVQRSRAIADAAISSLFDPGTGPPRLNAVIPNYPETYQHAVDRSRLSTELTLGNGDVGALGLGWHGPEWMDGVSCRCSSDYGIAFLRAPSPGSSATIRITCRAMLPTEMQVRVDSEVMGEFPLDRGGWRDITVSAPAVGDVVRVDILSAGTFRPSNSPSVPADQRLRGIPIARISIVTGGMRTPPGRSHGTRAAEMSGDPRRCPVL